MASPGFILVRTQQHAQRQAVSAGIWIATNEGVYLVQDNAGYEFIHRFTAQDSPLFSNVVNTIAVNGATGQVFFGTDTGLISYRSNAIDPVAERRDLFIYPNPVSTESDILYRRTG